MVYFLVLLHTMYWVIKLNIIDLYVRNISKDTITNFAIKNGITLSDEETNFVYHFIKNNYKEAIRDKDSFDFSKYKEKFSEENYVKIESLIKKYISYL